LLRTLFIVNPAAFGGGAKKRWEKILGRINSKISEPEIVYTQFPGHATQISMESGHYQVVFAVGGDGTVREIVTGIMQSSANRPILGIIPIGSGNDFARNLGIITPEDGLNAFFNKTKKDVDVFRLDCFQNNLAKTFYGGVLGNIGFGATVIAKKYPVFKRLVGSKLYYYVSTILPIFTFGKRKMEIVSDKYKYNGDCWMLIASNNEWAGAGGMHIAPGANPQDGLLHITLVPDLSIFQLFKCLTHLKSGSHIHLKELKFFNSSQIDVKATPFAIVEMDGDPVGRTPASIKILASALSVFMP